VGGAARPSQGEKKKKTGQAVDRSEGAFPLWFVVHVFPTQSAHRSSFPPHTFISWPHTYSIVAFRFQRPADIWEWRSSPIFPNVGGPSVPWAEAGVGAGLATQSLANIDYGRRGLELLAKRRNCGGARGASSCGSDTYARDRASGASPTARGNAVGRASRARAILDWAGGEGEGRGFRREGQASWVRKGGRNRRRDLCCPRPKHHGGPRSTPSGTMREKLRGLRQGFLGDRATGGSSKAGQGGRRG
jgi:hypothetical protein